MKNDPIFKFVAVIIVAGVLIAIGSPSQPHTSPAATTAAATKTLAAHSTDGAQ